MTVENWRIDPAAVAEAIDEDGGGWTPCTGCHESNEGYATGPYSKLFRTNVGCGCRECGGLGVRWEYFTDEDIAAIEKAAREDLTADPLQERIADIIADGLFAERSPDKIAETLLTVLRPTQATTGVAA